MNPLASLRDWLTRRREAMECLAAVELMTDYLEGAVDDGAEKEFESHLAGCPACTAFLGQMRATIDVFGRLEPEQLDPEVRDELVGLHRLLRAR
jgi:anti-sigma factor RsiW